MKITRKEIEHVAALAKLYLSEEEILSYEKEMSAIIEFADKLSEADTEGIEPAAHSIDVHNVFRKDEIVDSYKREELIANAPDKQAGCFAVPRIVE